MASAKKTTKAAKPAKQSDDRIKLHYNKKALLTEYDKTYTIFMGLLGFVIGGILLYFFIFVVYLGGVSHTPHKDFVEKFSDRIDYGLEYDGLKLPIYDQQ